MTQPVKVFSETCPPPSNKEDTQDNESLRPVTPYAFLVLSFLCLCLICSNVYVYNLTSAQLHDYGNGSESDYFTEWDLQYEKHTSQMVNVSIRRRSFLSNPQKEMLITVVPVGTIVFTVPIVTFFNKYGNWNRSVVRFKKTLHCIINHREKDKIFQKEFSAQLIRVAHHLRTPLHRAFLLCALLSLLASPFVPIATNVQTYAISIMLRILQGISLCAFVPLMCKICGFVNVETNEYLAWMLFSYPMLSSFLCMPFSGILTSWMGWHSAHYFIEGTLFIFMILYILCHYSDDFLIDVKERRWGEILRGHSQGSRLLTLQLPYLSIYQDIGVWGIFISAFAFFSTLHNAIQTTPTFFIKVLGCGTVSSSFLSAIPMAICFIVGFLVSRYSSRITAPEQSRMRILNSIGSVVPAVLLIVLSFISPDRFPTLIAVMLILSTSFLAACFGGFFKMAQKRSKQFHVFMLFHLFIISCVGQFFTSLLSALIMERNDYGGWSTVTLVHGILLLLSNIIFCLVCSPQPAEWTKDGYEDTSMKIKRDDPLPQFPL